MVGSDSQYRRQIDPGGNTSWPRVQRPCSGIRARQQILSWDVVADASQVGGVLKPLTHGHQGSLIVRSCSS